MIIRNCRLEVRLTKNEFSDLTRKARKARLTNAAFVRRAISDLEVKEAPPVDVPILIQEIRRVGHSINELQKSTGGIEPDSSRLREELNSVHAVLEKIHRAYAMTGD